jgi:hypothetical protein
MNTAFIGLTTAPDAHDRRRRGAGRPLIVLLRQIDRVVDRRALGRALLVLAAPIAAGFGTGDPLWIPAALVTASSFIAMEQVGLAPLGVALHGLAIAAGFLMLLTALPIPPLFAVTAAAMAAAATLLAAKGQRLRTPGNFVFIPSLYIACELAENGHGSALARGFAFLPYLGLALGPVLVLAALELGLERRSPGSPAAHFVRLRRYKSDFGHAVPVGETIAAVAGAVAIAALFVGWRHVPHAQWVIWSAASVVTGDVAGARRKLRDRAAGALLGVPIGLVLALAAPHELWVLRLAGLGGLLSLTVFRLYPVGFGVRCALVAFALSIAGELNGAAERVENVLVGGAIGLVLVVAAHESARLVSRLQTLDQFRQRINRAAEAEDAGERGTTGGGD